MHFFGAFSKKNTATKCLIDLKPVASHCKPASKGVLTMKKTITFIALATVATSILTYAGLTLYLSYTDFSMSIHGHIAVGLGIFFTYGVGAGLMALLFFSNKHGHDESVYTHTVDDSKHPNED